MEIQSQPTSWSPVFIIFYVKQENSTLHFKNGMKSGWFQVDLLEEKVGLNISNHKGAAYGLATPDEWKGYCTTPSI